MTFPTSRFKWLSLGLLLPALLVACPSNPSNSGSNGNPSAQVPSTTDTSKGDPLTVRFLDVGQGDAILVQSPEGKTLIYDGGRSAERLKTQLENLQVNHIDAIVASHFDADHIAGLRAVTAMGAKIFVNNGIAATSATYQKLIDELAEAGVKGSVASNRSIKLGSVNAQIIPPPAGQEGQNENSVGLKIAFAGRSFLFTGDSETPETKAWLDQRPDDFRDITFYKSIHHGANNGDHTAWLDVVQPKFVFIGVGPNNYGHPTASALGLYKKAGAKVFRTDQDGTISVQVWPDGRYQIRSEHGDLVNGSATGNASSSTSDQSNTSSQPTSTSRDCPTDQPIKGNIGSNGDKIYYREGDSGYGQVRPEMCFVSTKAARAAGFEAKP